MENCKLLKLMSGETLVCSIQEENFDLETYDKKTILLHNPVLVNALKLPSTKGIVESFVFSPWGFFSSQETFLVQINHIIMIADLKESIKDYYLDYITQSTEEAVFKTNEDEESSEEIDEDNDEDFEEFFNNITKKEEDEENETRDGNSRITYH